MATYRSSTSTNTGATAAGSIAVSIPAGIQFRDVLIAAVTHDGSTGTISTPTDWTLIRNTVSAGANLHLAIFWRLVDGTEPASYTWTFDIARQASATMTAYSGAALTLPASSSTSSTTTAGIAQAGTGTNATFETGSGLQFFALRNTTAVVTQTANAAYTKREDTCTTASVFVGLSTQDNIKTLPVTSTSGTGGTASTASTGICIAVYIEDTRPPFMPMAADQYVVGSVATSTTTLPATVITNVPNVTLFAWITINKTAATVSSLTASGITWAFVSRANTNTGSVELWTAFAPVPLASVMTTITFSSAVVSANFQIVGLINANYSGTNGSAAIGAIVSNAFTAAAATVNITTTYNNSWVWAAANSSTTATSPTAGGSQTVIRSQTDATNTTQSIMWRRTNYMNTSAGSTYTMNLTAPATATGNILAVEIIPQPFGGLGLVGVG